MFKPVLLVLTLICLAFSDAGRILAFFPAPVISHQKVFRPLTQELAKRGHDVVVVTPDPAFKKGEGPPNLTEIDVHDISYEVWVEEFQKAALAQGNNDDLQNQLYISFTVLSKVFGIQLGTPEVQAVVKDKTKKFDLVIVEASVIATLGLSYYIDAPIIQFNSFGVFLQNMETFGLPIHPLVHPTSIAQRLVDLSDWEKIQQYRNFYQLKTISKKCEETANDVLKRAIGPDVPSISELVHNVDMLFVNVNPIWEMNRPSPPNVIYLGGLHEHAEKELPKDLKTYLDSSKNGVIYVSFGTTVDATLLPREKINLLVKAFSKLPYDVLWKWNEDDLPGRGQNVKLSKWLPQADLLRHPKVKIFITQGGLHSTDEAIAAGVPLIGIPLLGDQWYNVEQYVRHKIGLRIDMETLSEEKIENSVKTIIKEESTYRKNAKKLHSLMWDQPQSSLERAVWWSEYVIRHKGAKHLRSPSANMCWTEYYEIKLISYILLALSIVILSVLFVICRICSFFKGNKDSKVKKS